MSQPPPYARAFSFTNFQAQYPTTVLPGSSVDLELNSAKATLDAVLANLALIQRDDGAVKNASIGYDQLKTEIVLGFNAPTVWVTGAAFTANSSTVFNGSGFYRCLITHTAGVFATDLAALKWQLIVNLAAVPLVNASQIAVTPSGLLTTDAQTSLQALDAGKAATSHTHVSSAISDSTAAGRALLVAADATAQNVLLGTTSLGFQSGDIKETATAVLQSGWYYCDGSNKNRVTDVNLFNAITIQQNGVLTNTSAVITGLTDTSNMSPGTPLSGTGVSALAVIQSVDSGTQVTMSLSATITATVALVIAPYGVGDGSTTFGLPNRAYLAVGRDNASGSATNVMQQSMTATATSGIGTSGLTVASVNGLFIGMYVSHPGIPHGTTIIALPTSTTITLSANTTGAVSASTVRFSPIKDAQTLGRVGGALSQSTTIVVANLPAYTPSGTVISTVSGGTIGGTGASSAFTSSGVTTAPLGQAAIGVASAFTGVAQGGISAPFRTQTTQMTIVMNFVIKR